MKSNPLLLVTCLFSFLGCTDEMDGLFPDPLHPNQKTFKSSLFIEVKNTEGMPVYNALVQIGNIKGQTNTEGLLYLQDAAVSESSYLTVEKEGYFHASRRFYPSQKNKSQFVKLILLSDSKDAFFTSSSGRTLNFDGGVTLTFPKDGYEFKTGGSYTGEVIVAEQSIPANDPVLSFKMPGDLTGIDKEGHEQALGSLGMMAVELRSASGELLQLKKDAGVDVQIKVPTEMLATAPSTIPMWYFDEQDGTWREEGEASLSGDIYSATVHHFSFWNCDDGFPTIKWEATFIHTDDSPASQVQVCITINDLNTTRCDYTNENGWIAGKVASGKVLSLNVIAPGCNEPIYSAQIGPFSRDVVQGPIVISPPVLKEIKISGIAVNCDKNPVKDGYVVINAGSNSYYKTLDKETGTFSTIIFDCNESAVNLFAVDVEKSNFSLSEKFDYSPIIQTDSILVCSELKEYLTLSVDGVADKISFYPIYFGQAVVEQWEFLAFPDSIGDKFFLIEFRGDTIGIYPGVFATIAITLENQLRYSTESVNLQITHFGPLGDFVIGKLSGVLVNDPGSSIPSRKFTGDFSVIRSE